MMYKHVVVWKLNEEVEQRCQSYYNVIMGW
jgi:hypothetical protein